MASEFIMTPEAGAEMILAEMGTKLRHYMPANQEKIVAAVKTVMEWNAAKPDGKSLATIYCDLSIKTADISRFFEVISAALERVRSNLGTPGGASAAGAQTERLVGSAVLDMVADEIATAFNGLEFIDRNQDRLEGIRMGLDAAGKAAQEAAGQTGETLEVVRIRKLNPVDILTGGRGDE